MERAIQIIAVSVFVITIVLFLLIVLSEEIRVQQSAKKEDEGEVKKEISALLADQLVNMIKFLRMEVANRLNEDGRADLARTVSHAAEDLLRVVGEMRK